MPPVSAYFGPVDLDRPYRSHPHYPFVTEVPEWLRPNLVGDPSGDRVYDGLVGSGVIDNYRICWGESVAPAMVHHLPKLKGQRVALFGSGALGMVRVVARAVGDGGEVTAFSPSWMEVALVRGDTAPERLPGQGSVAASAFDVDAPSLGSQNFDTIIVADLSLLQLAPVIHPVAAMAETLARGLAPEGRLVVVRQSGAADGFWREGQFERTGSVETQHELLASVGLAHKGDATVAEGAIATLYARVDAPTLQLTRDPHPEATPVVAPPLCGASSGRFDLELRHPIEAFRLEFFRPTGTQPMLDLLPDLAGRDVLEVGSGAGHFTYPLAGAIGPDGSLVALDIDPLWSHILVMRRPGDGRPRAAIRPHVAEGHRLDLPSESVDLAVAMQVPDVFIPSGKDARWATLGGFLESLRRVLRPGGQFALVVLADQRVQATAPEAVAFFADRGFSLQRRAVLPFQPPTTVTGIAIWATCFQNTLESWYFLFSVN